MKTLSEEFVKKGWKHRQIERHGKVAIYERSKVGAPHFEVVVIKEGRAWEKAGVQFPASELYPSSEQWGVLGWTYLDLASAKAKAALLIPSNFALPHTSQ